ncbi:hypothetical protein SMICM304S_08542 [Streptomyces microflavus]
MLVTRRESAQVMKSWEGHWPSEASRASSSRTRGAVFRWNELRPLSSRCAPPFLPAPAVGEVPEPLPLSGSESVVPLLSAGRVGRSWQWWLRHGVQGRQHEWAAAAGSAMRLPDLPVKSIRPPWASWAPRQAWIAS